MDHESGLSDGTARILVVCTGNVCRSPLAERLLQSELDSAFGRGVVEVGSAGTGALVDMPMDGRAASILRDLGGDDHGFAARRLDQRLVAEASLVLTATRVHRAAVVKLHPPALRVTYTLRELAALLASMDTTLLPVAPLERIASLTEVTRVQRGRLSYQDPESLDIIDPYRRSDSVYRLMRDQLLPAIDVLRTTLTAKTRVGG